MSETRKLVAILVADVVGADVDHFRFMPVVARPPSMKAFMFRIAACSTTCSSKAVLRQFVLEQSKKVHPGDGSTGHWNDS